MPFSWTCPYCGNPTTITDPHRESGIIRMSISNSVFGEYLGFSYDAISCPNTECRKLYFKIQIGNYKFSRRIEKFILGKIVDKFQLLPESSAKPQPEFIPQPIREDYYEACRIRELSPKASAALARRCLQGMIRDFWKITDKRTLKQEIEAIREKVDETAWKAIDAVREIGNIGAHMEKDVNLIIDVEPNESNHLIMLIEALFKEWYVARKEKEDVFSSVIKAAKNKKEAIGGEGEDGQSDPST